MAAGYGEQAGTTNTTTGFLPQCRWSSKRSVVGLASGDGLIVRIIGMWSPLGRALSEMRTLASASLPWVKVSLVGAERSPAMPVMVWVTRARGLLSLSRKTMRALRSLSAVISKEKPALEEMTSPPLGPLTSLLWSSCLWPL